MAYPNGPLLQALAERVLANLDLIEELAPPWRSESRLEPPYADTQLLISTLGVLVFPHEKAPDALAAILDGYERLESAVKLLHPSTKMLGDGVAISNQAGTSAVRPMDRRELARRLRNGIAHFNMRPLDDGGRFAGVRIWNEAPDGQVNLVADVDFDSFRHLARYVLSALAHPVRDLGLEDPPDPMAIVAAQAREGPTAPANAPRPPRVNDTVWKNLLDACGGDVAYARTAMDRALVKAAAGLAAANKKDAI